MNIETRYNIGDELFALEYRGPYESQSMTRPMGWQLKPERIQIAQIEITTNSAHTVIRYLSKEISTEPRKTYIDTELFLTEIDAQLEVAKRYGQYKENLRQDS